MNKLTDQEVCCEFMEPKPTDSPEQIEPRHMWGSIWWDWSISYGAFPRRIDLDACHEIEGRLTDEQWEEYREALSIPYMRSCLTLRDAIYLEAEQKVTALAVVLRPIVEAKTEKPLCDVCGKIPARESGMCLLCEVDNLTQCEMDRERE